MEEEDESCSACCAAFEGSDDLGLGVIVDFAEGVSGVEDGVELGGVVRCETTLDSLVERSKRLKMVGLT